MPRPSQDIGDPEPIGDSDPWQSSHLARGGLVLLLGLLLSAVENVGGPRWGKPMAFIVAACIGIVMLLVILGG